MVTVSLLAGAKPAVRPVFHFGMDIEDATQTLGRTDEQHPWLQHNLSCGTQKKYLTYQTTCFGSGSG